jgi:hypothetical protein
MPRRPDRLLTFIRAVAPFGMEAMRLLAKGGAELCRESWRIGISQAHCAVGEVSFTTCAGDMLDD